MFNQLSLLYVYALFTQTCSLLEKDAIKTKPAIIGSSSNITCSLTEQISKRPSAFQLLLTKCQELQYCLRNKNKYCVAKEICYWRLQ